jgi:DNA-3-methyladenine glycosylase
MTLVKDIFFDRDPQELAISLLGKVLRHKHPHPDRDPGQDCWLSARIIETEAYYLTDRASHSSLGYSARRAAMFMPPGTIYMYYARGRDSLNFSAAGEGNAVLIKSGFPAVDRISPESTLGIMQSLNPGADGTARHMEKLCAGQTLLCRSLNLRVTDWNQRCLTQGFFYLDDTGYRPKSIIQCRRLGIRQDRDAHLPYRYIDAAFAGHCTSDPRSKRTAQEGLDYTFLQSPTGSLP